MPVRTGRRKHQQVARSIEREVHRIERRVAHDFQARVGRPREDPLLVAIDEVERAGGVHRRAGDRVEAAFELLDCRAGRQHRRRDAPRRRPACVESTSSTAKFRSRTCLRCVTSSTALSYANLPGAQDRAAAVVVADAVAVLGVDVDVAEADAARRVDADRGRERRVAARHAIGVVVGDRDVLRVADLEGHGLGARRRFFLGLRRVELPVLDAIELDLAEQMMLGRQLVDVPGRRRVGDVEPRLRVGVRGPDVVERAAAAARHPDARVLRAPAPRANARARALGAEQRRADGRRKERAGEPVDLDVVEERVLARPSTARPSRAG